MCNEVGIVKEKEKEGREILQCFIYPSMMEGKPFQNVNSVSHMDCEMKSLNKEYFVAR